MKKAILKSALTAGVALSVMGSVAAQAEDLVVVSWGGAYEMSQKRAYSEPYMKEHPGTNIIFENKAQTALSGLRAQVEAGNVVWDLVDMLPSEAIIACDEGLIEPLDHDNLFAKSPDGKMPSEDFIKGSLSECFVPEIVYSTLIGYNTEMFDGKMPSTMADVFDVKNFPGKRALQKKPINNLEWALVADGVDPKKVYDVLSTPEGVDRAFAKLDTIKNDVIWWEEGAQAPQLLADKEVAFASGYNGRMFNAMVVEKQPFKLIWDGQVFELDGWVVPKGKLDKIKDFLVYATDTQRLADQAKYISYGPARASSAAMVSTHADTGIDMKPHMPTYGPNFAHAIPKNDEFWADHLDELTERFNAWLAS
ncbi:ABC transporter substrate-binding protein [Aestuariispira ectoiniformans]|uniref:ABC transporter substrate-binding protein n=1 Tax=Aestuariispira ectoiniformans TaxID=2775080 RepID=UPI00223B0E6D|nr:ABC transporter substrate-binding protein [Aestuariispira ectoiniformans]